jgi:glucan biosynthesis protein C
LSNERLFFVDNLRTLLTILVIVFHLAITYGAPIGDWQYKEGQPGVVESVFYTTFIAVTQAFFMGFFFLISGYFTPGSFDRKGAIAFLKNRLIRLGIPLLFYIVFIDPIIGYVLALSNGSTVSFLDFLVIHMGKKKLGSGPLWFLEALLIFAFGYTFISRLSRGPVIERYFPKNTSIAIFGLVLGIVTFIVRIWFPIGYNFTILNLQFPFFPQYIALYAIGAVAYKSNWLTHLPKEVGRLWSKVAKGLVTLFPVLLVVGTPEGETTRFAGGLYWQAFTLAIWEQLTCVAIILTLTVLFRMRYNSHMRLTKAMSESAYTAYIIHAPIIIFLALGLRELQLPLLLKWILVSGFAVPLCFAFGYYLRKLPVAHRIL